MCDWESVHSVPCDVPPPGRCSGSGNVWGGTGLALGDVCYERGREGGQKRNLPAQDPGVPGGSIPEGESCKWVAVPSPHRAPVAAAHKVLQLLPPPWLSRYLEKQGVGGKTHDLAGLLPVAKAASSKGRGAGEGGGTCLERRQMMQAGRDQAERAACSHQWWRQVGPWTQQVRR